jgi:DNA-directed RNA polymerase alpha subunit
MRKVEATQDELAAAFTEWDRRYREEPKRFMSEARRLLKETPETYGQACAPYLIQILSELRGDDGITVLDLSTRTLNALRHADITTVRQLTEHTERQLLQIRDFGKRALDEVRAALEARGLSTADY